MCGVAQKALANSSRSIPGSWFQVSMAAYAICPLRSASSSGPSCITGPREQLMKAEPGRIRAKNSPEAIPAVLSGPSVVNGTCSVTISLRDNSSSSVRKPKPGVRRILGGSQHTTRKPSNRPYSSTSEPTCPTPTIPSVRSDGCQPGSAPRRHSTAMMYCSTPRALHPAAVVTRMPRLRQ